MKRRRLLALGLGAVLCLSAIAAVFALRPGSFDLGLIPDPVILQPAPQDVTRSIFLISDADGWNTADDRLAESLRTGGALVVGIDLPRYLAALDAAGGDCLYLVSDIERLNQEIQRNLGDPDYRLPVLAGTGAGGALALAIAAQTPDDTVAETVAVDPPDAIALTRPLCTPAERQTTPSGTVYALTEGPLPNPVTVLLTPAAPSAGRIHVDDLKNDWPEIEIMKTPADAEEALAAALKPGADNGVLGHLATLPLDLLDTAPTRDAMAIVLSGDGGWRDLDKTIGEYFQKHGLPTVGLDSLRYFWSRKNAGQVAADLSAIMDAYRAQWGVTHVVLVGYSFGADVLPAAYLAMDAAHRAMISQVSLLGFSEHADFEISVAGWLGFALGRAGDTLPDLAKIDPSIVQCIYGRDETDSACPQLTDTKIELIETTGGHHFDGDYGRLADRIIAGFEKRVGTAAAGD